MTKLRQVARALADETAPFTNVLVSVDGERDTPAAMARFLEPFMPGFIGLTGDPTSCASVAGDFSAVFFKGMPTDTKGGYDVEHTPQVYLVDRDGTPARNLLQRIGRRDGRCDTPRDAR